MVQIHDDAASRGSFIRPRPSGGEMRFWPYDGGAPRSTLGKALDILQRNCRNMSGCNSYFSHLPGSRSLAAILDDPGVWIHWDPRPDPGYFGATWHEFPVADVTITNYTLNKGLWVTAATLVHEFAHVNGAPGRPSMAAENALPPCGLRGLFDPGAVGVRVVSDDFDEAYA